MHQHQISPLSRSDRATAASRLIVELSGRAAVHRVDAQQPARGVAGPGHPVNTRWGVKNGGPKYCGTRDSGCTNAELAIGHFGLFGPEVTLRQ